ncbi:MAG: DUF4302 domain-containing protein [Polaribacter sp.]
MKKHIIYKTLSFLLFVIAISSCSEQTQDLTFNDTASERLSKAINKYSEILTSSDNGWVFEYFPDKNQIYGGFNFIVDFNEKDSVDVFFEFQNPFGFQSDFKPVTSSYNVISNGGPVLTFNTYNDLMHIFAEPSSGAYQGSGGDYEFLILSEQDSVINLKGKVTGNNLRLIKLTETPQSYFKKVEDMRDFFNNNILKVTYSKNNTPVTADEANLTFTGGGKDGKDLTIAYIITSRGIKLYKTVTLEGNEISEFILDKTKKQLTSTTGNVVLNLELI